MKKLTNLFSPKKIPELEECSSFQMHKEEADTLYGGFKEYKPPIYEQDATAEASFKTTDLLTDIHQHK
ncbi:hypothetical protein HNQ91_000522 [Filimonas zeae]|uniref:Uncharacterized protein n=1 Tax=Filimonas zeae TaxID=1737353 RepID=A0A917IPK5_9BACT|nr:hypothetical protein [Filimonas zeae]MDR6337500.1 hypothetical protein [Filimonas zeae]GGH58914.1 hypothetical protein GCM10011379_05110 [Filimonas zeae]